MTNTSSNQAPADMAALANSIEIGHVRVMHLDANNEWAPYKTDVVIAALRPAPPATAEPGVGLREAFIRLQRRLLAYCMHANAGHMPNDAREFTRRILLGFQAAYEEADEMPPIADAETNAEYMAALRASPAPHPEVKAAVSERGSLANQSPDVDPNLYFPSGHGRSCSSISRPRRCPASARGKVMTILYNCHHDGDQYRISKFFDGDFEASYLCTHSECECPAGHRDTCRHRQMLPEMIDRGLVNSHLFLNWDHPARPTCHFDGMIDPVPAVFANDPRYRSVPAGQHVEEDIIPAEGKWRQINAGKPAPTTKPFRRI